MSEDGNAWFAPKMFGYGAGLPIAWQGWALLGAYLALVGAAAFWLSERHIAAFFAVVVPATAALILISKAKTRGGWHWRWGAKPDPERGKSRRGRLERRRQGRRGGTDRKGRR